MYGQGGTVPERNASTEAGLLRKQVHNAPSTIPEGTSVQAVDKWGSL